MQDNVKFIFKTLIKVPVIILITYFIFNIFAFTFTYFRLLGLSYVVMQTAVENNFIPPEEKNTLVDYLNSLETAMVSDLKIGCDTNQGNDSEEYGLCEDITDPQYSGENRKVQYGTPITVTVSANYNFIFPLVNTAQPDGPHADGLVYNENKDNNIKITYVVPGLKYYPDLS